MNVSLRKVKHVQIILRVILYCNPRAIGCLNVKALLQLEMELFLSYPITVAVGLIAFICVLCFSLWRSNSKSNPAKVRALKSRLPAEAGGAWPVIGHLHLLGGSQLAHRTLGAMADKYGPAFTIRLGVHRAVVISSLELAKELFTTHDIAISSRPNYLAAKILSYDFAMFGFSPYGAYWRELRKLVSIELLSTRRLELLKHVRVSETEISIRELYNLWKDKQNASISSSGYALVEMKQWFGGLTLNVILRMVAGKRYFGAIQVSEEKEARRCQKVIRDFFHLAGLFVVADFIPFLSWFDFGGNVKKMKATAKEIDQIVEGWLKEHRLKKELGDTIDGDQDFIDVMLSLMDGAVDLAEGQDADTITKATCANMITAGSDTTAVMLTWALSLLLNHPQVMRKAREELDLQVVENRRVTESDITNLAYLEAIVKETLRLYPAAPLVTRDFIEDCTIGGGSNYYHIPKGTRLMFNLWKLQRDPNIWPDPSEFRPERFLTTHKNFDVKGQQFELIPFGAGRRICPGLQFGLQILHLVLANVLHAFELSTPGNKPVDLTESAGLTNIKATPLEVLVAPRLSLDLY